MYELTRRCLKGKNFFVCLRLAQGLTASRKTLRLDASDGSLLAMIFGNTPEHIRATLTSKLEMALGASATNPTLKVVRTSEDLDSFPAFHFAYYSRMATKVSHSSYRWVFDPEYLAGDKGASRRAPLVPQAGR